VYQGVLVFWETCGTSKFRLWLCRSTTNGCIGSRKGLKKKRSNYARALSSAKPLDKSTRFAQLRIQCGIYLSGKFLIDANYALVVQSYDRCLRFGTARHYLRAKKWVRSIHTSVTRKTSVGHQIHVQRGGMNILFVHKVKWKSFVNLISGKE
jgi:hypothetical protein